MRYCMIIIVKLVKIIVSFIKKVLGIGMLLHLFSISLLLIGIKGLTF